MYCIGMEDEITEEAELDIEEQPSDAEAEYWQDRQAEWYDNYGRERV